MNWWIISNIEFNCRFYVFVHLDLIPYLFSIRSFLNAWTCNASARLYVIIVGCGYPHNHVGYTRFYVVAAWLLLYCTFSNYTVSGSIMVKCSCIRGSSWPSIIDLYWTIISTINMPHVMASDYLAGNFPYLNFRFGYFWLVLQTLMWVYISSFN